MKEGRLPDKEFAWGNAFTEKPIQANQFYYICIRERNKLILSTFQKKTIKDSELCRQIQAEH